MKLRNRLWLIPALVIFCSIPGRISPRDSLAHSLADATNFYNVKTFGAKADGQTVDTPAINRAIDSAAAAGGGTVYFPAGNYLSVSIYLPSKITHAAAERCVE